MKLAEQRKKEEEDPPKYFTRAENEETMNKDKIMDYWKVDDFKVTKEKYTYQSGATYVGEWSGGFRHG